MTNIFKRTALTRFVFFVMSDIFFIAFSVWLAFFLRFDFNVPEQYFSFIYEMIGLSVIFIIPVFYFQKLYSFSWSYVSANELIYLFKATTIAFILLSVAIFLLRYLPHFINFPRSTIFVSYVLVFILCGALRFSKRIYLRILGQNRMLERESTLIVGAGDAGEQILRSIISSKNGKYAPIGFVDDSPIKKGIMIHGFKVLGKISDIPGISKIQKIKQLIIALPSANSKTIREAVELGKKAGIWKIKIAPPISEIIRGEISLKNLKDVGVEDLLGREKIYLDEKKIEAFIKDKVVLITGAAGSIGSELSRQTAKFCPSLLVLLDQDETGIFNISKELEEKFSNLKIQPIVADILNKEKIDEIFKKFQPKIIFHAAAYKHVPLMEADPKEAIKNNIFGTEILGRASLNHGAENFIFISTDKAVNPSSVMGATKRAGEMICQSLSQQNSAKFISVRFGNVLDSRGSVIPVFRDQIRKRGPVTVTDPEMKRYFMLIPEACLLVLQSGAISNGGEVFVLDMGKPIMILDLAKEMIKLSGFIPNKDIAIVFTGKRPGEKLFEEMMTAEEGTVSTQNQNIFRAKLSSINPSELEEKIADLKKIIISADRKEIISSLKNFVPAYNPKD